MENKISIYSLTLKELEEKLKSINIKSFVASQIYDWLYIKMVDSFEEMTNISKDNIKLLNEHFYFDFMKMDTVQQSDDGTIKFLFEIQNNAFIETVLMNFDYGYSVCLTSQVGCNMGCKFCASGLIKKSRDITTGEFIKQFVFAKKYLKTHFDKNLTHIVVMGIGEPFDNFSNLIQFLSVVKQQKGLCISPRKITVSTCGLVNKINDWTALNNQVNLAISLHGSNDDVRNEIMPINRAFNIEKLTKAIDNYIEQTNRRVTIEYIMIDGLNDQDIHAQELIKMFKNKLVYINLIPYNPVIENEYRRSKRCKHFYDLLKKGGLTCTVRQEKGSNIDAACGQLRSKKIGILP